MIEDKCVEAGKRAAMAAFAASAAATASAAAAAADSNDMQCWTIEQGLISGAGRRVALVTDATFIAWGKKKTADSGGGDDDDDDDDDFLLDFILFNFFA